MLTVDAFCDALYGWDTELERALACCPTHSILTFQPHLTSTPTFPCVRAEGTKGLHVRHDPLCAPPNAPVRTLLLTGACSFGPRERFAHVTIVAPSVTTSDTAASWQLHSAGWQFFTPPRQCIHAIPSTTPALQQSVLKTWRVPSGVDTSQAQPFRAWAGLGTVRAQLGVVNANDTGECVAKHGSRQRVRALIGAAHTWPRVSSVS